MSSTILNYEEQLKEYIMNALLDEQTITFNQLLEELTYENQSDFLIIQKAFYKVKNELVGQEDSML